MDAQLNIEELRTKEMNVCICEPKQGYILGEDEDAYVDKRLTESLMEYLESSYQPEEMMPKESKEAKGSYVFTN
jgi:hypothetical protein